MVQAFTLIKDVKKKLDTWDERSQFKMKGVGNLSRSDLDSLVLYAQAFVRSNGQGFDGFMEPRGDIAKVLKGYGMIKEENQ
jgi:hypothetical protein